MFDRTIVQTGPRHVETTVTEHRAPTDDSVRLLREVEEVARSQVVRAFAGGNNTVNGVVLERYADPSTNATEVAVSFVLNGKSLQFSVGMSSNDRYALEKQDAIRLLIERMSKEIATSILAAAGCDLLRKLDLRR